MGEDARQKELTTRRGLTVLNAEERMIIKEKRARIDRSAWIRSLKSGCATTMEQLHEDANSENSRRDIDRLLGKEAESHWALEAMIIENTLTIRALVREYLDGVIEESGVGLPVEDDEMESWIYSMAYSDNVAGFPLSDLQQRLCRPTMLSLTPQPGEEDERVFNSIVEEFIREHNRFGSEPAMVRVPVECPFCGTIVSSRCAPRG